MEHKFTVAVCVDNSNGMTFNKRRQSKDRALLADFIENAKDRRILVNEFTLPLFKEYRDRVILVKNPLSEGCDTDVCFVENIPLSEYSEKIERLIIYLWNRDYPSDTKLDVRPEDLGMKLIDETDFVGNSHEKITKRVYEK